MNTIVNKTMEDSLATVKMYETARIEYDAYRTDLEFYGSARDTEINQLRMAETQVRFSEKKTEFEKLRADVQIKLKFLDDNRVSVRKVFAVSIFFCLQVKVMAKQLLLFHTAMSHYFSGNQEALEESMKQFSAKMQLKNPPSSWIEQ